MCLKYKNIYKLLYKLLYKNSTWKYKKNFHFQNLNNTVY